MTTFAGAFRARSVAASLTAAAMLGAVTTGAGAAPASRPCASAAAADLNGDGLADLVAGQPEAVVDGLARAGAVDVRLTSGPSLRFTAANMGTDPQTGARFGAAVATGEVTGDCITDLIIGEPGADARAGRAFVIPGSTTGPVQDRSARLDARSAAGDRFGLAVAAGRGGVFVAAPFHDPNGVRNAGRVVQFRVARGAPTVVGSHYQGSPGVVGQSAVGDHFGQVLAVAGDTLGVGIPDKNTDGAADSGAVQLLRFSSSRPATVAYSQVISQSGTMPDTSERNDHFGAALDPGLLAVGVPGEDTKRATDAGAILTGIDAGADVQAGLRWVSQSSRGVPGVAETGDRFGAAVASAGGLLCVGTRSLLVGAPGEDRGLALPDIGAVTALPVTVGDCSDRAALIDQDSDGIAGKAKADQAFGAAFFVLPSAQKSPGTPERVFVGAPGTTVSGQVDAGRIVNAFNLPMMKFGALGGAQESSRYGSVTTQF